MYNFPLKIKKIFFLENYEIQKMQNSNFLKN